MLYVLQSLAPGEDVVRVGEFHWLYNVSAVLSILFGIVLAVGILIGGIAMTLHTPFPLIVEPIYVGDSYFDMARKLHPGVKIAAFLALVFSVFKFVHMMILRVSTEIVITTDRLIYKQGIVSRLVGEINTDRIESVSVYQSFWGRIFNFGRVIVRGQGVGEVPLPDIADPIEFRRAIEKARRERTNREKSI